MVSIKRREDGFILVYKGLVSIDAALQLRFQLQDEWAGLEGPFVLVLDVRHFRHFTADAQALMEQILEEALEAGLYRIAVLGISTAFAGQFCNMMMRADVMPIYQFLDVSYEEDWRAEMEAWLSDSPDDMAEKRFAVVEV